MQLPIKRPVSGTQSSYKLLQKFVPGRKNYERIWITITYWAGPITRCVRARLCARMCVSVWCYRIAVHSRLMSKNINTVCSRVCVCACVCVCVYLWDISIPSVSVFGTPARLQTVLFATLSLVSVCVCVCAHAWMCVWIQATHYSCHVTKFPFPSKRQHTLAHTHKHTHTHTHSNVSCKVCCNDTACALKLCL